MGLRQANGLVFHEGCSGSVSAICFQPAWRQMDALVSGRISSVELLNAHIKRFEAVNPSLNSVIKTDIERARERANALDRMRADGKILGPLHGLPMTIKDTLDVESMPATAGAPQWAKRGKPVPDAAVVARAKAAGAIIWGKTNAPFMASDWQSYNRLFGQTNNPYDLDRTPGGSSGGAGAALAAGVTPLEIGSDIGGSLRIPAHFCGVASLKPTFGVIPQTGHVPPSPEYPGEVDLNVVGPMARCVQDLKLLRGVIMHGAIGTKTGFKLNLDGMKLALWSDYESWPLDKEMGGLITEAVGELPGIGAELSKAKPDVDPEELMEIYLSLLIPIVMMDAPESQRKSMSFMRPWFKFRRRFEKSVFTQTNWVVKATQSHIEWMIADGRRAALKAKMRDFFQSYDALLMPVSPTPAFPHDTGGNVLSRKLRVNNEDIPYASNLSWVALATACHLPAVTIPLGRTSEGLPVGLQIVGAQGEDARVLDIAEACEGVFGGYRKPDLALGLL